MLLLLENVNNGNMFFHQTKTIKIWTMYHKAVYPHYPTMKDYPMTPTITTPITIPTQMKTVSVTLISLMVTIMAMNKNPLLKSTNQHQMPAQMWILTILILIYIVYDDPTATDINNRNIPQFNIDNNEFMTMTTMKKKIHMHQRLLTKTLMT
ncbi:hypothetical protein BC941DRAFT_411230 [Chlamydoabsidia padenii]|nr:hypothetical protein BC941DRAFT_411230 [Chlamydoabsidia padenii]